MTFGWGADYEDTYPRVAEQVLQQKYNVPGVRIINLARVGADPRDYLTYVRRYAVQFRPQLIVIGFLVGNDCPISPPPRLRSRAELEATLREYIAAAEPPLGERLASNSALASLLYTGLYRRVSALPRWGSDGRRGPVYGEPNPLASGTLTQDVAGAEDPAKSQELLDRLRRGGWIDKGLSWDVSPWLLHAVILHPRGPADSLVTRSETAEAMRQEWQLCAGMLREIHHVASAANAELVILVIPHSHAVSQRWVRFLGSLGCEVNDTMTTVRTINDWLAEFAAHERIPCIDALDEFRAAEARGLRLYFDTDDHMTPQGYRLLGEILAAELQRHLPAPH